MGKTKHRDKRAKKSKKEKKSKKKHSKEKHKRTRSSSDSSSSDEWVEKVAAKKEDDFSFVDALPTYSKRDAKDDIKTKKNKKNIDDYDPSTCSRELNPYWKDGGKGLPKEPAETVMKASIRQSRNDRDSEPQSRTAFKKAADGIDTESVRRARFKKPDDDVGSRASTRSVSISSQRRQQNWKRRDDNNTNKTEVAKDNDQQKTKEEDCNKSDNDVVLTDQEMNALGAKIVKAEIMGNKTLVDELNARLARARELKKHAVSEGEDILLTMSDSKGNVRPLSKTENASASRGNKRRADTHSRDGKRDKYFPDDDKYSLNKMFINEKFETGERDEEQFMKAVARHTNPNDDLDDIYQDNITANKSDASLDEKAKNKAINEHKRLEKSMESCNRCIESNATKKHLIISMRSKVYLSVPESKSLTEGHCILSSCYHLPCATMLDEDVWEQIKDYRKAITRMFESQNKDVVFFETVKNLHWKPHFTLHCVPMPRDVGDTAAIYFKKAISECEMEWSTNKKVIDLKGPDVRRGVPKGLPYFWVHFGMDLGFAHVIEDSKLFPDKFAEEILGGILDLDHRAWRKQFKENFEHHLKKVKEFMEIWKYYEEDVKH